MKVVVVGPYGHSGSVRKIVSEYATYLSQNKIDVHVITADKINKKEENYVHNLVQFNFNLYRLLPAIGDVVKKIKKINPDIIHVFGTFIPYSAISISVIKEFPTLLTVFGLAQKQIKYRRIGISDIINVIYEKLVMKNILHMTVESKCNKSILQNYTRASVYVVPTGINIKEIRSILDYVDDSEVFDILYVGRLSREKGLDVLINSIKIVGQNFPDIVVKIAGAGPYEIELKKLVRKLELEKNIQFLGYVQEIEKFRYYKSCKIVVVPSRWDFSPITVNEAMACGKPVIVSDMTNSDLVINGKTGYVFKTGDSKDLAEKILSLLWNDHLMKRMSKKSLEIGKKLDWEKIVEAYIEIYNDIQ